ncbi:MAG TPA: response regulator transcription factor [Anaeromyxobacteraceae bacterium]|nr:response regulator transcription factor [Anaeromyxobacteraceae bacterium]
MARILIVDDHEVVRRGLRQVLEDGLPGAQLEEAANYEQAVEQLGRGPWDMVLLDISLPGRSGLEILEESRRDHPGLPVLMLSASPEEEFATRCIRLGAAGYLAKTSAAHELLLATQRVLSGGRYISAALGERLAGLLGGGEAPALHEALSRRELEVLLLVAQGRSLKQIAADLGLAEKTVATYRARIGEKLRLSTNVELTRYALQHGLAS